MCKNVVIWFFVINLFRSYFHYTDVITVVSNGKYVRVDPLELCESDEWPCDLSKMPSTEAVWHECRALGFDGSSGTLFRLPLRCDDHNEDAFGPIISEQEGRTLIKNWTLQLAGGDIMLFLSSVSTIQLFIWEAGCDAPTCVSRAVKSYARCDGDETTSAVTFLRLPIAIPEEATQSYAKLESHLLSLNDDMLEEVSAPHYSEVTVRVFTLDDHQELHKSCERTWLVVQQFSREASMLKTIKESAAIPVVGIAVCLSPELSVDGRAFCFLPIGEIMTNLPVHVNASFQVHKNRRNFWLHSSDGSATGLHQWYLLIFISLLLTFLGNTYVICSWAEWNKILMTRVLPLMDILHSPYDRYTPNSAWPWQYLYSGVLLAFDR